MTPGPDGAPHRSGRRLEAAIWDAGRDVERQWQERIGEPEWATFRKVLDTLAQATSTRRPPLTRLSVPGAASIQRADYDEHHTISRRWWAPRFGRPARAGGVGLRPVASSPKKQSPCASPRRRLMTCFPTGRGTSRWGGWHGPGVHRSRRRGVPLVEYRPTTQNFAVNCVDWPLVFVAVMRRM
jgi:hypothetical protein